MAEQGTDFVVKFKPTRYQARMHAERARFSTVIFHRRGGKTEFAVMELIIAALETKREDFRAMYIAPFRKQAKVVAWAKFKRYIAKMPGVRFNETELLISLPNGSSIRVEGADNYDALRGDYLDACVMDEVADMVPEVWGEVVRPMLSDHKGWCIFIGTPKGINMLFDHYNYGLTGNDPNWNSFFFDVETTVYKDKGLPWLDAGEIESAKRSMTDSQFRQEFMCDFNASTENTLIPIDVVAKARGRHIAEEAYKYRQVVFGVDVARFGSDSSVIVKRQGLVAFEPQVFKGLDNVTLAQRIYRRIIEERPAAVFIDAGGTGSGVIDYLHSINCTQTAIVEVAFGGKAHNSDENGYVNRRAEMWDAMGKWLEDGGSIPNNSDLVKELVVPQYKIDARGRTQLEDKSAIKARVGRSPDMADALALTFAEPMTTLTFHEEHPIVPSSTVMYAVDEVNI